MFGGHLKKLFLFLSLVALLLFSATCYGGQDADSAFREAVAFEKSLNIFQALDKNREAIRLAPDNVGYLDHYAWLLHNYGFLEEAVDVLAKLRPRISDPSLAERALAWDQKVLGKTEQSANLYREIYKLNLPKDNYQGIFAEAAARNIKEQDEKIAALKAKLQIDKNNPSLMKDFFHAYLYKGDEPNALSTAKQVLSSYPADAVFRYEYAMALAWSGKSDEAETVLKSLIMDIPDNAFLYYQLGRLQNAASRLREAQDSLQQSLRLYPDSAKTKRELSEVLARRGKTTESSSLAFSISGDSLDGNLAKARSYHFSGRLEPAIPLYQNILATYPGNEDALWGLTETSLYSGRFKDAEKTLSTWSSLGSDTRAVKLKKELIRLSSPALNLIGDFYSNSSHFQRINYGASFRYPLAEGFVPTMGYYHSRFMQNGYDSINRNSIFLEAGKKLSDIFSVNGRVDLNLYDNDQDHLNGNLFVTYQPVKSTSITLGYQHMDIIDTEPPFGNPLYSYVVTIGSVGKKITTNDYSLLLVHKFIDEVTLWGKLTYGDYSDGNRKLTSVLEADYRPRTLPNLLFLYNYFYLDYRDPAPPYSGYGATDVTYYDPRHFQAHTIGVEYEYRVSSALTMSLRQTGSFLPENGGTSTATFGAITYDLTPNDSLRCDGRIFYQNRGINRNNDSGHFRAESVMLTYTKSF